MRYTIDTGAGTVTCESDGQLTTVPLYSTEGFELISQVWLKVGWNEKYTYTFTWMGRPVVQLPDDLVRIGELVHRLEPDVILECGVAHGGSLVYYASLCKVKGKGRVVGIDVEIRPHNRAAIEAHPLSELITLIEGSSIDEEIVARAVSEIGSAETVMVVLDSAHNKDHVLAELEAYSALVSTGSYIIVMDGIMALVADTPQGDPSWSEDNPVSAVHEFCARHPEFVVEQPGWVFNESELQANITYAPQGFLLRQS
jgi:cephalosporin hydroxylase